ncbi:conserved hypothetical protein [Vibrio crassostreae]|uniref:Uncharacterized protein n=1 Tax=Vibrio crassostreae TaxID=246167 RepID=A0A822N241_9VIBR|nr:conserved hypothetical protein [Vibrio crassostreae]CDT20185.1 conserved hypothetical protein [Vibrio crassostreae]CDT41869.1 conserved hypothetical protein [Vibrio crassostreae]CDT43466.1 conserved hypothetical protein [Vibrio crassostreae]CDT45882.1 conserved hypothetical protein [Vibrio crassostreae]
MKHALARRRKGVVGRTGKTIPKTARNIQRPPAILRLKTRTLIVASLS